MIVKKLRDRNGWTQEQLAECCDLNVRTIQRVESGKKASLETLHSLASVFEVDISKLTEEITVIDKEAEIGKPPLTFGGSELTCSEFIQKAYRCLVRINYDVAGLVYWISFFKIHQWP